MKYYSHGFLHPEKEAFVLQAIHVKIDDKKPDRPLLVVNVGQATEWFDEPLAYMYQMTLAPGEIAGNHYHRKKGEVILPPNNGTVRVSVVDVRERHRMKKLIGMKGSGASLALIIQPYTAHAVENMEESPVVVTVLSTRPPREKRDDCPFQVTA